MLLYNGLQQPGCILCLKLVIFWYSLSHFCDWFWNVTMIMNIRFIGQFCSQSINFAKVFHKKNLYGPPRGLKKSARDQNLSKTLADFGRFWLTLADSDRLWMTLADSGCPPESVRVSQIQPESASVSYSRPESARGDKSQLQKVRVHQGQ